MNKRRRSERQQLLLKDIEQSIPAIVKSMLMKKADNKRPSLVLDDFSFQMISSILAKTVRNENDLFILQLYLKSISQFTSLMEKSRDCKSIDDLLYQIAQMLKYEKKHCKDILFRQGERGNKFYIIFKGKTSVLILKEAKYSMSYKNYLKHLIYLKLIKEDEICTKIIHTNTLQYFIEEKELDELVNELSTNKQQFFFRKTVQIPNDEMKDFELFYKEIKGININKLSVRDYVDLSVPRRELIDVSGVGFEISTFVYYQITTKQRGDCFGEIALFQGNTKRTATILCEEDCTFGTLTREAYNSTIRDIQNKIRKNNVNFLLRYKLFSEMNYAIFESKFFNFFIERKINQGQYVITQGLQRNEIHFIREGDFELVTKCNNKELAEIIRIKAKIPMKNDKRRGLLNEDDTLERVKLHEQNYRIAIVRQNDVIGLNDLIYSNKYICTAVCISPTALIYSIESPILDEIKRKIPRVQRDLNQMIYLREDFILNRLSQLLEYANNQQRKIDSKNIKKITLLKLFNNNNKDNKKTNSTLNATKCKSKLFSSFRLNNQQCNNTAIAKSRNQLKCNTNISTTEKSLLKNPTTNSNGYVNRDNIVTTNTNTAHNKSANKSRIQTGHNHQIVSPSFSLKIRGQSAVKPQLNKKILLKQIMGSSYKERKETNESKRLSSALTMRNEDYSTNKTNDSIVIGQGIIDTKRTFFNRRVIVDFLLYDNYVNPNHHQTFITSTKQNNIKYYTPNKNIPVNYCNKARPLRITCLKKNIS